MVSKLFRKKSLKSVNFNKFLIRIWLQSLVQRFAIILYNFNLISTNENFQNLFNFEEYQKCSPILSV